MFNSSGAVIPRVCLFFTLSPHPHDSPFLSLSGPISSYLWQCKHRIWEEQYCICALLCTLPAAKQMLRGGILVAGLAPGPRLIPQWLYKHALGQSKEHITPLKELYVISTPIKVYLLSPPLHIDYFSGSATVGWWHMFTFLPVISSNVVVIHDKWLTIILSCFFFNSGGRGSTILKLKITTA